MVVNWPLLPVTLPVTDTNPPVKLAAFDMVVAITLLAVTLPVELMFPTMLPIILPAVILPLTLTTAPVKLVVFTVVVNCPLLAVTLPGKLTPVVENTAIEDPVTTTETLELSATETLEVPLII